MGMATMKARRKDDRLPKFLQPHFWEADLGQVSRRRHEFYIIERLIEHGDDRAIRWLRRNYTPARIAEVVRTSRAISPNTANLWALLLGIPRGDIRCFSEPSLLPHSAFSRS